MAQGTPVSLKSTLGQGYTVQVILKPTGSSEKLRVGPSSEVLERIRTITPSTSMSSPTSTSALYHLQAKDPREVSQVLSLLEDEKTTLGIESYDVHGASMEDIFLSLMKEHGQGLHDDVPLIVNPSAMNRVDTKNSSAIASDVPQILRLINGRQRSPFSQAFTIFHKRCIIARRSWLTPALSLSSLSLGLVSLFSLYLAGRLHVVPLSGKLRVQTRPYSSPCHHLNYLRFSIHPRVLQS